MSKSKEQIKIINKLDLEISDKDKVSASRLSSLNAKKAELEKEDFADFCLSKIRTAYPFCKEAVDNIVEFQDRMRLAENSKLATYLGKGECKYVRSNFVAVFSAACNRFKQNVNFILGKPTVDVGSDEIDKYKKIAQDYLVIEDIYKNKEALVNEFVTDRINKEAYATAKQISELESSKSKFLTDGRSQLAKEIELLEKMLEEEQEALKSSELCADMAMQTEFSDKYGFCIGKSSRDSVLVSTKNVNYKREISSQELEVLECYNKQGYPNIVIDCQNGYAPADAFIDNVIMKFIASYPTKFKKVVALHNQAGSPLLQIMSKVHACGAQGEFAFRKEGSPVANTAEDIETVLSLLDKRVNDVCFKLGREGEDSIYSYNAKNPDNAEPITLVVVRDFPSGFTRGRSFDLFERVFTQGSKAGIIMLVAYDKGVVKEEYGDAPKALQFIENAASEVDYGLATDKNGKTLELILHPALTFKPLTRADDFSDKSFFARVNEELKLQDRPIDLFDVQPSESFESSKKRTEFSESLYIPLGKDGGQPSVLKLSSSDKAHVVVNGGTGSGKTAFLHTLILSAANNYAPDELEINLFDFKDGVGFKMYKEKRLPHVNFIALENKIEDAQDILTYINSLMTERNKLISSFDGVNSLKGYNQLVASGKYPDKPKIPRCLIIIDEYQFLLMNEKCVNVLENIARQGRSAGMSLVLVSQDVPTDSGFTKIKQLLDHRFAFRGSPENVDRLISGAGKRAAELELQKGLCFYEANDGRIRSMRTAFSGDDAQLGANIDKIVAKYPGNHRPLHIVGSPKPLTVDSVGEIPTPTNLQMKKEYLDSGICRFAMGKYSITQEPVEYVANELSTLLVVVGNYVKSKQIATSIIVSMLRTLREVEDKRGKIVLADMCEQRRLMNLPSPLTDVIRKKVELEDEGDETTLEALTCYDSDGFEDMVDYIYEVYESRCDDKSAAIDPIEVILMSADTLSGSGRALDKLREVIVNGKKCDIYFTIQVESLDSNFAKTVLMQRGGVQVKDLVLLSESEDNPSRTSMEIRSALNAISGIVGSKVCSEYIKSLEKNPLHHSYSFMVDGGSVSKFSHYQYQEGWIDSLINEIK